MSRLHVSKALAARAVLAAACVGVAAFQWPSDQPGYRTGFGSARGGTFSKGLELSVSDQIVKAPDDVDLVFACDDGRLPGGFPLPGGSIVALAHSSGLMSVFTGLQPGSLPRHAVALKAGEPVGAAPPDGGRSVNFYAYDALERRFINPLSLLPRLADNRAPAIRSVTLVSGSQQLALGRDNRVRQGEWGIRVDAADLFPSEGPSAPFQLAVLVNGSELANVRYDAAWAEDGALKAFSAAPVYIRDYILPDGRAGFGPVSLVRGTAHISVVASDFEGNVREAHYTVQVF